MLDLVHVERGVVVTLSAGVEGSGDGTADRYEPGVRAGCVNLAETPVGALAVHTQDEIDAASHRALHREVRQLRVLGLQIMLCALEDERELVPPVLVQGERVTIIAEGLGKSLVLQVLEQEEVEERV